jgi:predicted transcriptional regulator of viral defense system
MNNNAENHRLISLNEAAELYGFNANYLRNLILRGRLKGQKFGHIWSTTPADIEEYIRSRQEKGAFREDIQVN